MTVLAYRHFMLPDNFTMKTYSSFQNPCNTQNSVTSLYGRFRAKKLPYKAIMELWGLMQCCKDYRSAKPCNSSGMLLHLSFTLFQCRFHINVFLVPCTINQRLSKLNAPLAIVYKSQLHWAWIPTVSYAHHNCIFQTDNWKHNASYIISDLQWAVRSMDIAWLQLIWGSLMLAQKEQMDVKIARAYCNCMSGE